MSMPSTVGAGRALLNSAQAFDPRTIVGLKFWLDASRISGLSDGAAVAQWDDSSGQGNHATQATAANQPVYKAGVINGRPVVRFDGSNDSLRAPFGLAHQHTQFVVLRFVVAGGSPAGFFASDNTSYAGGFIYTGGKLCVYETGANFSEGSTETAGVASIQSFISASTGLNYRHFKNGAEIVKTGTNNIGTGTPSQYVLGARANSTSFSNCDIAEVLCYNSALSDSDRARVQNYLGAKYGIAGGFSYVQS